MARVLSNAQALDVAGKILNSARDEDNRLARVNQYLKGTYPPKAYIPQNASNRAAYAEYLGILTRSKVPVLSTPVELMCQNLYVDGYRPDRATENAAGWAHWQANRMDARQAGLHRDAVAFGASYLVILPGTPVPVWRPVSPLRMRAVYADSLNDEWPTYALEAWTEGTPDGPVKRWRLYDDEAAFTLAPDTGEVLAVEEHGTGFCPVVRYVGEQHLDGELTGEVEPLIPLQDQLDATTFMIEMAQQYGVHRQRWVTGMAVPEDNNGNPVEPFKAAIDRLWVAEDPDTKFGEFGQTDIKAWLDAREATLRHIAIKSQTPPGSLLLGSSVTFPSAEALAATEKPHQRRTGGYKTSLGESHEQAFRLDALQAGNVTGWEDQSAQVVWRDLGSQSLAQTADALGKLALMLGIPTRGLWDKVPGVTDQDLARWEVLQVEDTRRAANAQAASIGMSVDEAPAAEA